MSAAATPHGTTPHYFIPSPSRYPVCVAIGLFLMILGGSQWINGHEWGAWSLLTGVVVWLATLAQWFGTAQGPLDMGLYSLNVLFTPSGVLPVPLPASLALLLSGLGVLFWQRRARGIAPVHS